MAEKNKKQAQVKRLVSEINDLWLRLDSETRSQGFYWRLIKDVTRLQGNIDQDTTKLARIKTALEELKQLV